ncbi:MAG: serine hydrolase [Myxococcales bacterium]|nr:serine hydrolase [Myxococcales bacterium]
MVRTWIVLVLGAGCVGSAAIEAAPEVQVDPLQERLQAVLQAHHERAGFVGTALVAQGDTVRFAGATGPAELSWSVPNTPETRFRIGSVTKQFTAALVLQQVEEGTIALGEPIGTYLEGYPSPQGEQVTVHQLLTHRSGIPNYTALPGWRELSVQRRTPTEFLPVFSELDLEFEPGAEYRYSNSNYFALGAILEATTGIAFGALLQQRLLDPLGLADSGYDDGSRVRASMARGYVRIPGGYRPEAHVETSLPYAAGMMFSTVGDLHRWNRALRAAEPFAQADTLAQMLTSPEGETGYALGIVVQDLELEGGPSVRSIGHSGRIEAFGSENWYLPDGEWSVVVLSNTGSGVGALADDLIRVVTDRPVQPPLVPVGPWMGDRIAADGIEAATAAFRALRDGPEAEAYDLGEYQLNGLGYTYLSSGDVELAIAVFELNVQTHPERGNPHDSLGEAVWASGDGARALTHYRRSLQLDPDNTNAARMIEEIEAAQ